MEQMYTLESVAKLLVVSVKTVRRIIHERGVPTYRVGKRIRELVLIGGGQTHLMMLGLLRMSPLQDIRVTLISNHSVTCFNPYLFEFLSGNKGYDEAHLDARKICALAGVRFVNADVLAIDTSAKKIHLNRRPSIDYDLVSLNLPH